MDGQFKLHPSRQLCGLLLFAAPPLCFLLYELPLAPVWCGLGMCWVLIATIWVIMRDATLWLASSYVAFQLKAQRISLLQRNGEWQSGLVCNDSLVTPFLILLNVRTEPGQRRRSLVLLPDSLAGEELRRLRVLLRCSRETQD